jgi:hypothetical protein
MISMIRYHVAEEGVPEVSGGVPPLSAPA